LSFVISGLCVSLNFLDCGTLERVGECLAVDEHLLRQLAEQQYMFHLLVKILLERGVLKPGEPEGRYESSEFSDFLFDYLERLRKGEF